MNVALLGGNGYIGRAVTRAWIAADPDAEYWVLSRSGTNDLLNMRIHNVACDVCDPDAVVAALPAHVDAIADFVGGVGGLDLNLSAAESMLVVAQQLDVPVMGYVGGTLGSKEFVSAKRQVIETLRASGRRVEVVEPTLVYGAGRDDKLSRMVPLLKFCGIFSRGLRPVRVEDVAAELVAKMRATQ